MNVAITGIRGVIYRRENAATYRCGNSRPWAPFALDYEKARAREDSLDRWWSGPIVTT